MSSQRGNTSRQRSQKYNNATAFKNDLNDKSPLVKYMNSLTVTCVCDKCKSILEWKIKYKKYKPLTVPRKCTKCEQKTVKEAYHIICQPCALKSNKCAKCGKEDFVDKPLPTKVEQIKETNQFEREIDSLRNRKKRTLMRHIDSGLSKEEAIEKMGVLTLKDFKLINGVSVKEIDDIEDLKMSISKFKFLKIGLGKAEEYLNLDDLNFDDDDDLSLSDEDDE